MPVFRDCWDSVRGNVRDCLSTPLTKKKLLIFGGVFILLVVLIIILVVSLSAGSSSPTPETPPKGQVALAKGPTVFGGSYNVILKDKQMNMVNSLNDTELRNLLSMNDLSLSSQFNGLIWPVGASDCLTASQRDAVSQTLEEIDVAIRITQRLQSNITLVTQEKGLLEAKSAGKVGVILSLNGGYGIDSRLAVLRVMYNSGVRIMSLTNNCSTPWAGNFESTTAGLTAFGQSVVKEANRLGIILDLARSSFTTIDNVLGNSSAPVIFNGVGAMTLNKNTSNIDDNTISVIKGKAHCLVMVTFNCLQIQTTANNCTINDAIQHINYFANALGKNMVGIDADFIPGNTYPTGLQNLGDVSALFNALNTNETFPWSIQELEGLAFGNFLTVFKQVELIAANSTTQLPVEALESYDDFKAFKTDNMSCYTDWSMRKYPDPASQVIPIKKEDSPVAPKP